MFPRHLTGEDLKGITDTHKTQLKIMEKTLEDEEEKERQKMIEEGKKKMPAKMMKIKIATKVFHKKVYDTMNVTLKFK